MRPRAVLGDVLQDAIILCLPDHAPAPDYLKDEVKVCLKELDDAEAVEFREAWLFLYPDLEGLAPAMGGQACCMAKLMMYRWIWTMWW